MSPVRALLVVCDNQTAMASFIILCYLAIINSIGKLNVADISSEFSGVVGIFVANVWSSTRSAFIQVGGDLGDRAMECSTAGEEP